MARVRIWISKHVSVGSVFIVDHDDGQQEWLPLRNPPAAGTRIGVPYVGEFRGHSGVYHDLPRGFPTNRHEAEQRLNDPSIPANMQQLIRGQFTARTSLVG